MAPKPSEAELAERVDHVLSQLSTPALRRAARPLADNTFELYVFSQLIYAARLARCSVSFQMTNGQTATSLRFRGGPGLLFAGHFSHAVVMPPRHAHRIASVEVHIGVKVKGRSTVDHECDVAVVTQFEAEKSRRSRESPSSRGLRTAFECKLYSDNLRLAHGRGILGSATEFGGRVLQIHLVTNAPRTMSIERLFAPAPRGRARLGYVTSLRPPAITRANDPMSPEEAAFICKCVAFWRQHFGIRAQAKAFEGKRCQTDGTVRPISNASSTPKESA